MNLDHLQLLPSTPTSKCLVVTTYHEVSHDDLAALRAIAGVLYPDLKPGWVQFRGYYGDDSQSTPAISLDQCQRLVDIGALERDEMAWNITYLITERGKRVVALMEEAGFTP